MSRLIIIVSLLFFGLSNDVFSKSSGDTTIIFFESNAINKVLLGKIRTNKKLNHYPEDITRRFLIKQFTYCEHCQDNIEPVGTFEFYFSFEPNKPELNKSNNTYFKVSRKELVKYKLLDANWFNHTPWEEIRQFLIAQEKNLYLIDNSFKYNDKYFVLKVDYEDPTTQY